MSTIAPPQANRQANAPAGGFRPSVQTQYILNVPLLVGTLVGIAVISPLLYLWHSIQLDRTAVVFLTKADELEKDEEWKAATNYLDRYLRVKPDDVEARIRLAKAFEKVSKDNFRQKGRAVELYYRAVGLAPKRAELRRSLAELLLEIRRFPSAKEEAEALLELVPNDPAGIRVSALAKYGMARAGHRSSLQMDELETTFKRAIKKRPDDVELATTFAWIYRHELQVPDEKTRAKLADQVVDQMVEINSKNWKAFLERYRYRMMNELPGGEEDIKVAVSLAPKEPEVQLAAGENMLKLGVANARDEKWELARKQFAQAKAHFVQVKELEPKNWRGHLGLGQAFVAEGKNSEAIDVWRSGLVYVDPDETIDLHLRIAGMLIGLRRLDEADESLAALDAAVEKIGPKLTRASRNAATNEVNFLRAKWHLGKGNHRQAVDLLEGVLAYLQTLDASERTIAQRYEALMLMGTSQASLRQWDESGTAFEEAATLNPDAPQPRQLAAHSWTMANQPERAKRHLEQAVAKSDASESVWLSLIETEIRSQLQLAEEDREWALIEGKLDNPPEKLRDSWRVKMLQVDLTMARQGVEGRDKVIQLLKEAEAQHPRDADLLQILAVVYRRLGLTKESDRAVTQLADVEGNSARLSLVRAEIAMSGGEPDKARKVIENAIRFADKTEQLKLRNGLVRLNLQGSKLAEARDQLELIHKLQPEEIDTLQKLADLSLEMNDFAAAAKWEDALRKKEGKDGTYWRFVRARRLLVQAETVDDPKFMEAVELQRFIANQRSSWSAAHLLKGMLSRRQNRAADAIEAYERAIALGDHRLGVYEQLIELLYLTQRFDEADKYITRVKNLVSLSERLPTIAIGIALVKGDTKNAVQLAKKAIASTPDDPMARIRYGHALYLDGKADDAEIVFRDAVRLAPKDSRTWNALLSFYLRSGQRDLAEKTLQALPKNADIEAAEKSFILAQGYSMVGDQQLATKYYEEAVRRAPDNVVILMRFAEYFAASDPAKSKAALERAVKLDSKNDQARRMLALLRFRDGGHKAFDEALALIASDTPLAERPAVDLRLEAALLRGRGGVENRTRARQIYTTLIQDPTSAVPEDYLNLAGLFEAEGRYDDARMQYEYLAGRPNVHPDHLATAVDYLLRNDDGQRAGHWIKKLVSIDPDNFRTLQLQARWLKSIDETERVSEVVERFSRKKAQDIKKSTAQENVEQQKAAFYRSLGDVYSAVEMHQEAEKWYRYLTKISPLSYQSLARNLVAQGRVTDAIRMCREQIANDDSPRPAIVLATAIAMGDPSQEDYKLAEPVLTHALEKYKDDPGYIELLFAFAYVRTVQQRVEEAAEVYKEILELQPKHIVTLNNLAAVLSEIPSRQAEAIRYIDEAIDLSGPKSALLDTKAMILINSDPEAAIALLLDATAMPKSDPRFHLHLAMAYKKIGSLVKAKVAVREALANKLEDFDLTRTDLRELEELKKLLNRGR